MQLPLLSGVVAGKQGEFRLSYPTNFEPVIIASGLSKGQLRAAAGATPFSSGPGVCRGAITWDGTCYRVMGSKLVKVASDGAVSVIGDVGDDGRAVALDYSFDRLIVASERKLFYFDGATFAQVTDEDLVAPIDALWFNGFTVTTDGTYVGVTELSDPTAAQPLKYGSAEQDPDMVTGLMRVRGELYVTGRYTIEVQQLVGGNGFPFQVQPGATIPFGCVAPRAKTYFDEAFAFVGSERPAPGGMAELGVYIAGSGTAEKISTRRIDDELAAVADPTSIELENRTYRDEKRLLVHLPGATWVYLRRASLQAREPVWYRAQSGRGKAYRLRHAVSAYGKTIVGDVESGALGLLSEDVADHFGEVAEGVFDVGLLYNEGKGGIINEIELTGLLGRAPHGDETTVFLSFTNDGETFSDERPKTVGAGDRARQIRWRPGRRFRAWTGLRFRVHGRALLGFAACEADVEALGA